jgi:tetratricopeptide (TPR) repeat protein
MKKATVLILFISLFSFAGLPQEYKGKARVRGYVYDEQGNPIEGVTVKLYFQIAKDGFTVETDKNGKWVASWIRNGEWNIDFEKAEYIPNQISVQISEVSRNPDIEITLKRAQVSVISEELEALLSEGNSLFAEEKYQEAIVIFTKMLEEHPEIYLINKNIGNCYFMQEKYDLAEEFYKKVLEQEPDNTDILLAIGNCYINRRDKETALEWFQKIEFEKITDPAALFNIGSNFFSHSQYEEALKYYKRAIEIQEDFLDAVYQLGLTYLTLMNYEKSIKTFEDYIKYDSDSERAAQVKNFLEFLKTKIKKNEGQPPAKEGCPWMKGG